MEHDYIIDCINIINECVNKYYKISKEEIYDNILKGLLYIFDNERKEILTFINNRVPIVSECNGEIIEWLDPLVCNYIENDINFKLYYNEADEPEFLDNIFFLQISFNILKYANCDNENIE